MSLRVRNRGTQAREEQATILVHLVLSKNNDTINTAADQKIDNYTQPKPIWDQLTFRERIQLVHPSSAIYSTKTSRAINYLSTLTKAMLMK